MIEPQRLLARMNPVPIDWKSVTSVTGQVLKAEDIAACLAGLERGPYLLILYLWCHDQSVSKELNELLLKKISHIALMRNWKCKNERSKLSTMLNLAMHEIEHDSLCDICHGTGVNTNKKCDFCHGVGKKRLTQYACAKICGIKRQNWQRCWADKYKEICMIIYDWNERGINHLLMRL